MNRTKMEVKTIWILVLLIYSNVSDGEFYDANNSVSVNSNVAGDNNLASVLASRELNNGDEPDSDNQEKSVLRQAEMNFLAKLRHSQRQGQIIPAIDASLPNPPETIPQTEPVYDIDWQSLLVGLLDNPDHEVAGYRSLEENLGTIMRFLAQRRDNSLLDEPSLLPAATGEDFSELGQKRAAALRTTMARRSHTFPFNKERFTPSISVGALTNLGDFFQHLKHNLESLESKNLSKDQVKLLEGENMISNLRKGRLLSRLPQACRKCSFSARISELPTFERNPSAGIIGSRFVSRDQLSRPRVQTSRTGKVIFPLIHRPLPLLSC
ncbi:uncharacterized protein LOC134215252 isoform X2 [Armigeres subalbatus]|uniref:uncharacterized protein LOC134215252 isoform X2 n=1 Tax=Armigeres subalbatus TaxID=124917 RepID=UPI002ED1378F